MEDNENGNGKILDLHDEIAREVAKQTPAHAFPSPRHHKEPWWKPWLVPAVALAAVTAVATGAVAVAQTRDNKEDIKTTKADVVVMKTDITALRGDDNVQKVYITEVREGVADLNRKLDAIISNMNIVVPAKNIK